MRNDNGSYAMSTFKALVVTKPDTGYACDYAEFDERDLMEGDVTVRITHSTV
jgi:acrylyl-CoA reductase (NADPH)